MDRVVERAVKRRRHLGVQAWRELFERFASAGVSVEEFCRREGLCRSSFNRWRSRLQPGAAARPALVPAAAPKTAPSFVELGVLGAAAGATAAGVELRIELGGGVTLTLVRR